MHIINNVSEIIIDNCNYLMLNLGNNNDDGTFRKVIALYKRHSKNVVNFKTQLS